MKYLILGVIALCASASVSIAQKKGAQSAEIASTKPVAKKGTSSASKLYLLSNGDKTSQITREDFKKIKKKDIEYVKELKDPVLLSMYGDKAKSGVILVQMKHNGDDKKRKARQDSSKKSGS